MRLEEITVRLRRRTTWEALDLGHAMLRAWAAPAYRAWFATFWLFGLLLMALFWQWPTAVMLVLWWLKPLFDRILLFTYSRALFGQQASVFEVLRALPRILREPGILSGLTWRRFSLARSFLMPVWQLEEQRGAAARGRFRILSRRTRGNAIWLTVVCSAMVNIFAISLGLLIEFLAPVGSEGIFSWEDFFGSPEMPLWKDILINVLWMTAETLVEPLYVASGFSLYLNRRGELEGWDIELAFRRLAARLSEAASGNLGRSLLMALLLTAGSFLIPDPGWANEPGAAAEKSQPSPAKQTIQSVLADPVFGKEGEEKQWRWRPGQEAEEKKAPDLDLGWVEKMAESLGRALRVIAWIIALALGAFLLYLVIRYREAWLPLRRQRPLPPDFLFGLDVRPESLPDDIVAAARSALAAGRVEEALSLLYRGALVALIHRLQIEFRAGDTEKDCLHRVRGKLENGGLRYFHDLLASWQSVAYAREIPPTPVLEALCADWEAHFGRSAAT